MPIAHPFKLLRGSSVVKQVTSFACTCKVKIDYLSTRVEKEDLEKLFGKYGRVGDVTLTATSRAHTAPSRN